MADSVMPLLKPHGAEALVPGGTQQLMRKKPQMWKKPVDQPSPWKILPDTFEEGIQTHRINRTDFSITRNTPEVINADDSTFRQLAKDEANNDNSTPETESAACPSSQVLTQHSNSLMRQCTCCMETTRHFNIALAPCGHEYCRHCVRRLFKASLSDVTLFPPRCCKIPIPLQFTKGLLSPSVVKEFEEKHLELTTPDPTYCASSSCRSFVKPDAIVGDVATCTACGNTTCTICKSKAHCGDCPKDTSLDLVLELASENGWQRCFSCRRILERDFGCNHMICPCGEEFCYDCGLVWKSCQCEVWEEEDLFGLITEEERLLIFPDGVRFITEDQEDNFTPPLPLEGGFRSV